MKKLEVANVNSKLLLTVNSEIFSSSSAIVIVSRDDYEAFLRDLEEDPELRSNVNLYKVSKKKTASTQDMAMADDEMDDDAPEVPIEELLEDLTLDASDIEDDVDMI